MKRVEKSVILLPDQGWLQNLLGQVQNEKCGTPVQKQGEKGCNKGTSFNRSNGGKWETQ